MDPKHQIIINRAFGESRVAILYGTRVERLLIERDQDRDILGNIYVGKIKRVLPGMQSAFVEIGLDRTAFLFGRDARDPDSMEDDFDWEDDDNNRARQGNQKIENLVKEGQEIIVQVGKEPLGTKGARITMRISLPGRFVVLVPFTRTIGVSKRIQDDSERSRLREILQSIDLESEQIGYIVRTAAEGQPAEHLRKDAEFLLDLWKSTKKRIPKAKSPEVIYENLPLHERVIREHYHVDTDTIMIDDPEAYKEIKKFLQRAIPGAAEKLQLYKDILPIFDAYGIERDLEKAISSRIDLPSGGYLVIDHTEALTSFDVNTGSFVGRKNAHDTIFQTNMEAVEKIVEQILIRNLGGIIVLDLIDMDIAAHRDKIFNRLSDLLKDDKEKTNVLRINELGLIQMTRKRTSDPLEKRLMRTCPSCQGKGRIKSLDTIGFDCLRDLARLLAKERPKKIPLIRVNHDLWHWFEESGGDTLRQARQRYGVKFKLMEDDSGLMSGQSYRIDYE